MPTGRGHRLDEHTDRFIHWWPRLNLFNFCECKYWKSKQFEGSRHINMHAYFAAQSVALMTVAANHYRLCTTSASRWSDRSDMTCSQNHMCFLTVSKTARCISQNAGLVMFRDCLSIVTVLSFDLWRENQREPDSPKWIMLSYCLDCVV